MQSAFALCAVRAVGSFGFTATSCLQVELPSENVSILETAAVGEAAVATVEVEVTTDR